MTQTPSVMCQASGLTVAQFDAAELHVRREIGRCDFGTQKLAVLDYFFEALFSLAARRGLF